MKKTMIRLLIAVLMAAMLLPNLDLATSADAAVFYGDYSDVSKVYDYGSCPSMQGMAVGSQMLYTIKINSNDSLANIYMTDKDSGTTTRMTDSSDGSYYFSGFGHANDMAVWGIDGASHLFVTSTEEGYGAITRLQRSGSQLTRVAYYSLSYNGTPTCATAFDIMSVENGKINFITKLGQTVYTGSVDVNATYADIPLTKLCTISKERVTIKGETLDLSDWVNQGFGYHKNTLYVPITGPDGELNRSVVCVYNLDNVVPGSTIYPTDSIAFRITSGAYSALFEIESADICTGDNKLYFNTNRRVTDSDTNHDGVSSFDGYTFSKLTYNADETLHYIARFMPNGGSGSMEDQMIVTGVGAKLRKNTFTRAGYTFAGWTARRVTKDQWFYTNGSDSGWYAKGAQPAGWYLSVYGDEQAIANTTSLHKDVAEFYAQWEKNTVSTYTVTWNVNGVKTTETYNAGQTPSFKGSTNKASSGCTSYTFAGWDKTITPVTANVTYTAVYTATTNHSFVTVSGKAATCTESGLTDGVKCSACGYVKTAQQTIPSTGHTGSLKYTNNGDTHSASYSCCGAVYVSNQPHSFDANHECVCGLTEQVATDMVTVAGFSLSFESNIQVNMYYSLTDASTVAEHGVLVFYNDPANPTVAGADEVVKSVATASGFCATTKGISAKELGDTRYYVVYLKRNDGSCLYTKAYTYSPKQYAMSRLEKSSDTRLKSLCVAMLNYGAAAQKYFNYRTGDLMNAELTAAQKAMVNGYDAGLFKGAVAPDTGKAGNFVKTATGFSGRSATVSFEGAFAINYYFAPSESVDDTLTLYYWSASDYASVATLRTANATGSVTMERQADGSYWAQVEGIAAKQLDDTYYVAGVYTSDTQLRCTGIIAYSLSRYCLNNANGTMGELAQNTAMYGYYAAQYFA